MKQNNTPAGNRPQLNFTTTEPQGRALSHFLSLIRDKDVLGDLLIMLSEFVVTAPKEGWDTGVVLEKTSSLLDLTVCINSVDRLFTQRIKWTTQAA